MNRRQALKSIALAPLALYLLGGATVPEVPKLYRYSLPYPKDFYAGFWKSPCLDGHTDCEKFGLKFGRHHKEDLTHTMHIENKSKMSEKTLQRIYLTVKGRLINTASIQVR